MTAIANLYPYVFCDAEMVEQQIEKGRKLGCKKPLPEKFGYSLIGDKLVPISFDERVADQLLGLDYPYGYVLSKEDIFNSDFLDSLDVNEHAVLMPVLLELVARGEFPVDLLAPRVHDYEWENEAE